MPIVYWSFLEVQLAILIACVPAIRALSFRLLQKSSKNVAYNADSLPLTADGERTLRDTRDEDVSAPFRSQDTKTDTWRM